MTKVQKIGNDHNINTNIDVIEPKPNKVSKKEVVNNALNQADKRSIDIAKQEARNYKRIGTSYYLYHTILTAKKQPAKSLKKWTKSTIKEDFGSKIFDYIEKYFGFVLVPDNTESYQRNVNGSYNLYEPVLHNPAKGQFPVTMSFLEHIFGDYIEIGLDYLTLLFTHPTEKLPALCLVSKEQKTGKSTFLHWLCHIYGDNSIILGNEDFGSNFNTSWASRLVIGIDESFIEKRVIKEKIKRLVTDDSILTENKGVDKERRDFFGKFILLSNNEDNFIQMEKEDSRFFVLKIPTVKNEDPFLDEKMIKEIPAFLYFLKTRELIHEKKSRLWFQPKDYETEALKKIVKSSKSIIEKTIIEYLTDLAENIKTIDTYKDIQAIQITPTRLADGVKEKIRYANGLHLKIGEIFKDWGLIPNLKPDRYKYPVFQTEFIEGLPERVIKFQSETGKFYNIPFSKINLLNQ